jgi:protoporphyrinogen oxidase
VLRRVARGARPAGRTFLYPRRGFGQIPEALADAAVGAGAALRCSTTVTRISSTPGGARLSTAAGEVEAGVVLSTLPLGALVDLVDPGPPPEVRTAVGALRSRAMVLAYLVLDRPQFTRWDAHYFPAADEPVARVSEPRNYRHDPGQPDDVTVLCVELPCDVGDGTWTASDDELAARSTASLGRMGLGWADAVAVETRRVPHLYPVMRRGFAPAQAVVESWVAARTDVVTLGRAGLFTGDNTHHAMAMGAAAARCVRADGAFDHAVWALERHGFRSHVVED